MSIKDDLFLISNMEQTDGDFEDCVRRWEKRLKTDSNKTTTHKKDRKEEKNLFCELPASTSLIVSVFNESSLSNAFAQHTFTTTTNQKYITIQHNPLQIYQKHQQHNINNDDIDLIENLSNFTSISAAQLPSKNQKISNLENFCKTNTKTNKVIKPISQIEKNARVIQWIHGCAINKEKDEKDNEEENEDNLKTSITKTTSI